MKLTTLHVCVAMLVTWTTTSWADEAKAKPAGSEAPSLLSATPFVLTAGSTNKLAIRGHRLDDLHWVRLLGGESPIDLKTTLPSPPSGDTKTDKAKEKDKEKDKNKPAVEQSMDAEFRLPDTIPLGTNVTLVARGPKGESNPLRFYVAAKGNLIDEKEPNGGFKDAQAVEAGWAIHGSLSQTTDVDVFKIRVKAGQTLRANVFAAQLGSNLDASVNVYDMTGALLASNDDTVGKDPVLTLKCSADSECFIALSSVADIAGKSTAHYVLQVRIEP